MPSILAATAVTVLVIFPLLLTGALSVQMQGDIGFSTAELGLVLTAFPLAGAMTSVLCGRFVRRLGGQPSMRVAVLGSGITMLAIGIAAHSPVHLIIGLAVAGFANALSQPAVNLFLATAVPLQRQGFAFGIRQAALPMSALLGGLAVPVVALTVGWRWAFIGAAALAIPVAITAPLVGPMETARRRGESGSFRRVPIMIFAVAMGVGFAAHTTLATFTVPAAVEAGIAPGLAGLLLSFGSGLSIVSRLLVGHMADRRVRGHLRVVIAMLCFGAAGYALLALGTALTIVIGTVLAFGLAWAWIGLFLYAVIREYRGSTVRVTGILQTGGLLGAAVGPMAFGLVADVGGFPAAWLGSGLATFLAAALMLVAGKSSGGTLLSRR
jgi:MFS family permease